MNLNVVTTRPFVSCKITKKFLRKTTVPRKEFDRTPFGEHCYNEIRNYQMSTLSLAGTNSLSPSLTPNASYHELMRGREHSHP